MDLVWVPSHIGILGNEAPDEAVNESLLQRVLLPRVMIKVAPMKSALRCAIRDRRRSAKKPGLLTTAKPSQTSP